MNFSCEGLPVVLAEEMARIEQLAYAAGESEEIFMENAGSAVAEKTEDFIFKHHLLKEVTIIAGKGNNAGDAFVAGRKLLIQGFKVVCYQLHSRKECSPLCQAQVKKFEKAGGKNVAITSIDQLKFSKGGVILDGIVGTGFRGKAEGLMAEVIEKANLSALPILAIDIPSGLNGSTGEVGSVAIQAAQTFSLGLPKQGFFIQSGWDHVGELLHLDFGLKEKWMAKAAMEAFLMKEEDLLAFLPPIKRTRHKYERGYLLAIAGSQGMSGAAIMACTAALRSGAGIVRWFYPKEIENEIQKAPLELLKESWDLKENKHIFIEGQRAKAFILGPGIGRSASMKKAFKEILENIKHPCVIDADALYFIAENPKWKLPKNALLTPHRQEMERILNKNPDIKSCQSYVEAKKITLILKGAPTFVFHPKTKPIIVTRGDPAMATAGAGDVLTGILGALLAQGLDTRKAACLGATLHGLAGEHAAAFLTSYSVIASDLIQYLPEVFGSILAGKKII